MDELDALIGRLQAELTPLERALRLRQAEEGQRLRAEEDELLAAQARLARAEAALKSQGDALAAAEAQRPLLQARTEGWRGQLWRIGHGSAATLAVGAAVTSLFLTSAWVSGGWALGALVGQLALFGAVFFLLPPKGGG